MSSLTGKTPGAPDNTYLSLLRLETPISGSMQPILDGAGSSTVVQVSSGGVIIAGTVLNLTAGSTVLGPVDTDILGKLTVAGGDIAMVNSDMSFHSSTSTGLNRSAYLHASFSNITNAVRTGRLTVSVADYNSGGRECLRFDTNGTTFFASIGGITNTAHTLTVYGNVGPSANNTHTLGSASYYWSTAYITTLSLTTPLAISSGGTGTATTTANKVFAGPVSGSAAAPSFRSLVADDIPDLSSIYLTSGSYQPLDGDLTAIAALSTTGIVRRTGVNTWTTGTTVSVAEGGTGQVTAAAAIVALLASLSNNDGDMLYITGGVAYWDTAPGGGGGGSGTVTSVAMTVPSFLSVAGSPITTSGTFAVTLQTQVANTLMAGPSTGADAAPTFRALVVADIPDLSGVYQPLDGDLTAIAALSGTGFAKRTGANTWAVGTLSTGDIPDLSAIYQPLDGDLTAIAALSTTGIVRRTGTNTWTTGTVVSIAEGGTGQTTAQTARIALLPSMGSNALKVLRVNAGETDFELAAAGGSGTVTSVDLAVPAIFSLSGNPITTAGTITVSLATQTANTIWAGPSTGSPATPTFRALVAADIPDLSAVYQPLDGDLTAIAALGGTGFAQRTGANTWAVAALSTGDIPDLSAIYQPLDGDLTALAASSGTGISRRTGANTWTLGTTVSIAEGGTGQTTAQNARIALLPSMGSNALKVLRVNSGETDFELATVSVSPAGSDTQIQYNNSGSFGASSGLTWTQSTGAFSIQPAVLTSGNPVMFTLTGAAHTGLTASSEVVDVNINLARTVQRATGAVSAQRAVRVQAPTYSFVGSSTITDAITFDVSGAPAAGTNATLTRAIAVRINAGAAAGIPLQLVGAASQTGDLLDVRDSGNTQRFQLNASADIVMTPVVRTTGTPTHFTLTGAAHTSLTASAEATDVNLNLARTVQFSTGGLTTQRAVRIQAPTYAAVGSSTITTAVTVDISSVPAAGTNVTITNQIALRINAAVAAGVPLQIIGAASQTGNLIETRDSGSNLLVRVGGSGDLFVTPAIRTTGTPTHFTLTGAAHTTLTLSTEATDVNFNLARTVQFATGALTTQRAVRIQAPTYAFSGSSTLSTAVLLDLSGAPVAGTNATITTSIALRVASGFAAGIPLQLNGAASQTGDYIDVRDSGNTQRFRVSGNADVAITPVVRTTGSPNHLVLTGAAHTTLTASTEAIDVNFNLARTVQFSTGAITTQRAFVVQAPTYAAVGSSTITTAVTMDLTGAPVAGTNATITNTITLRLGAGVAAGIPLQINAAGSQTGDLVQIKNSGGTVIFSIDKDGYFAPTPLTFGIAVGSPVTVGTNVTIKGIAPYAGKIIKAKIYANTGPTGADLICDINLNGTSIWAATQANRIKVTAGNQSGTQTNFDTTTFAEDDLFSIDVDQVGSTIAGQDITVELIVLLKNK